MKTHRTLAYAIAVAVAANTITYAQQSEPTKWVHVFRTDNNFTSAPVNEIENITYTGASSDEWDPKAMALSTASHETTEIPLTAIDRWKIGNDVPKIIITTETPADEVASKEEYLRGTLQIDGQGIIDDFPATPMGIRGRGNSTWKPDEGIKLPYRVKFDKKQSLAGMKKAKNYVLLANHYDHSLIRNALAMEIARLLGIAYVNTMVPVDVYFNNIYKGSYNLTEKVGINSGSLHDLDEANSVLFELDDQMDEQYVFTSSIYNLPVMVKNPDMTQEQFDTWKADFEQAEQLVKNGRAHEAFDAKDFARYILMFSMVANRELRFPKSGYIYKTRSTDPNDGESKSLYHFGPVWDFDMAFGNVKDNQFYGLLDNTETPLFNSPLGIQFGEVFFKAFFNQPAIKAACDEVMNEFIASDGPAKILNFYDEYAARIESTSARDMTADRVAGWRTYDFDKDYVVRLRAWIEKRINYVTTDENYGVCK